MANTYYDSDLTGEQIEQALEAIDGVIVPANNGKVLAINNGKIEARSVQWDADLGPKSITENGTYNPASDNLDGYSQVTVNVSGGGGTTDANHVTYDSSVTYDSGTVGAALNEQRNTLNQLDSSVDNLKTDAFGSINLSGTNTTGSPIQPETFFYNNGVLVKAYRTIGVGAQINLNVNASAITGGALNSLVLDYIEPAFTNGKAIYDMSTKLAARGLTALDGAICIINSGSTNALAIRGCDISGDKLTIVTTDSSYTTSAVGVFVLYCGH